MTGPIIEPPAQYQHEYLGQLTIHEIEASKVDGECRKLGTLPLTEIMACSIRLGDGACVVILPKFGVGGVGQRTQDALRRHEIAHCNGWVHRQVSSPRTLLTRISH